MIAGLGNIIGDGDLGSFIDWNGGRVKWSLINGDVYEGIRGGQRSKECLDQSFLKVAILISKLNRSSGEPMTLYLSIEILCF